MVKLMTLGDDFCEEREPSGTDINKNNNNKNNKITLIGYRFSSH